MNSLEQAADRFIKLPPLFQEAIRNFDYDKKMAGITEKHKLHIDQAFILEKTIADIIFGDIHSDQMIHKLESELHMPKDKVSELAIDVNGIVLLPIREAIKAQQTSERTADGKRNDIEADDILDS